MGSQNGWRFGRCVLLLSAVAVLVFLLATGPPRLSHVLLGLALVIGLLTLSVPLMQAWFRGRLREYLRIHGTLDQLKRSTREFLQSRGLPTDVIESPDRGPSWSDLVPSLLPAVVVAVLLPVAIWATVQRLLARFWPGAPHSMAVPITLALLLFLGAAVWQRHSHQMTGRSLKQQVLALPLLMWSFGFSILTVILSGLLLLVFAIAALPVGRDLLGPFLVYGPLGRCDYEGALRRLRFLSRWKAETPTLLGLRGDVLLAAGRPMEAEVCWRECVEKGHRSSRLAQALDLSGLGAALTDQRRFEEARLCLGKAIWLEDGTASPRQNMAELYLYQAIEPEKALRFIDLALAAPIFVALKSLRRQSLSELWADKAWALALLGRHTEAEEAIQRALKEADPKFLAVLAGVDWRLGMALIAMGRPSESLGHFSHACQIDPNGKYGNLAARAITADSTR